MDIENATYHHLAEHVNTELVNDPQSHLNPGIKTLSKLFRYLFYASMNSEEGELIKVRVTYINPHNGEYMPKRDRVDRWIYTPFEKPIPLELKTLVKLSKSADPWSTSLAVHTDNNGKLVVFGLLDQALHAEKYLSMESASKPEQAGLFQAVIIGIGSISVIKNYNLVATLKQDVLNTEFIDVFRNGPVGRLLNDKATKFKSQVQEKVEKISKVSAITYTNTIANTIKDTISRLIIQIKNYHHGGAFLIGAQTDALQIKYPLHYKRFCTAILNMSYISIVQKIYVEKVDERSAQTIQRKLFTNYEHVRQKREECENELKGVIKFVASHTCVDGLVLLNEDLEELGYGTIIGKIDLPDVIYEAKDDLGTESLLEKRKPSQYGTRHQSMISYCWLNPGSLGIVISQDGDVRVFTNYNKKLIMWENIKTHRYLKPLSPKTLKNEYVLKNDSFQIVG